MTINVLYATQCHKPALLYRVLKSFNLSWWRW